MKENYTGFYSCIQYALKGDVVHIIKREDQGMILVINANGLKFYIHEEKLSQQPIQRDQLPVIEKQRTKRKIR
jgi:hypothetical protein